jgi:hypothetical protein
VAIRKRGALGVLGGTLLLCGAAVVGCNQQDATPAASPSPVNSPAPVVAPPDLAPPRLPAPKTGAIVTGKATLVGKAPTAAPVVRGSDPFCARTPIADEVLMVDAHGGLRNVLVRVVAGAGGPYLPPTEPVTLTQAGCLYRPRVLGIVRGQPVQVSNSDATMHNVHALLGPRTVLNQIQVDPAAPLIDLRPVLAAAKTNPLQLRCDIHPWMTAYLWVIEHPFFAVTGEDGTFSIPNLAAGEYVLEAWHEQLGTQRAPLTISGSPSSTTPAKPARIDFRFTVEASTPSPDAGKSVPTPTRGTAPRRPG